MNSLSDTKNHRRSSFAGRLPHHHRHRFCLHHIFLCAHKTAVGSSGYDEGMMLPKKK